MSVPNRPDYIWYQRRFNVSLAPNMVAKDIITAAGRRLVDDKVVRGELFALAEPGVWLDPSDLTTLFQDTAGTTPVTTPNQTVALALDKSRGLVLGPELWTAFGIITAPWTSVGGGVFNINGSQTANRDLSQTPQYVANKFYVTTFTLSGVTGGAVTVFAGEGTVGPVYGNGTHTIRSLASQAYLIFRAPAGVAATLSNISVRELPGFHATQSTAAARPIYGRHPFGGRRNLLTRTEEFNDGAWVKSAVTVSADAATAPNGTLTADKLVETSTTAQHFLQVSISATAGVVNGFSVYAKAAERGFVILSMGAGPFAGGAVNEVWFNLATGSIGTNTGPADFATITPVGDGWYRCFIGEQATATGAALGFIKVAATNGTNSYAGDGTSGILIWGAQLELGSTATAYQRVTTQFDVTEAGVPDVHYLFHGGASDPRWMITPTITPGTDKVQVFAGVRKLSDAAIGVVAELSTTVDTNNGSLVLAAPANNATPNYYFGSKGTLLVGVNPSGQTAPVTTVLTGLGNISGDNTTLRVNGTQAAQSTADQGTGNFLAYPLYIGMRGGTSLPFNGHNYGLIVRFGANLDPSVIAQTERWMAGKTGIAI